MRQKLHIGGVQFFYYFGVHAVRRNDTKNCNNEQDEEFLRRHHEIPGGEVPPAVL
jgi:hypothetical protein